MTRATCPDVRRWQALLEGGGAAAEWGELIHHLETCAGCQHTLEALAAEPAVWEDAGLGLADAAREEPALRQVVERLKGEDPLPPEAADLSFLRPADGPGFLGMNYAPFTVQNPGQPPTNIRPPAGVEELRVHRRQQLLYAVEDNFAAFAEAITRKLVTEIAGTPDRTRTASAD